jgi:RNA polymerase sigma factor (sigma-70 family)
MRDNANGADSEASAYERYYRLLRYIAVVRCGVPGDEVRPLAHDVFVSFLRHRARIQSESAWLVGAMYKACHSYWRSHGRADRQLAARREESEGLDVILMRVDLARVLAGLSEQCRNALRLRFLEGRAIADIAVRLGVTDTNAKQIIHRCTRKARTYFLEKRFK